MADILPDCRAKQPTKVIKGTLGAFRLNMVPVYCGNCGVSGPLVPMENMTFAFWLCKKCEKFGAIAGTMQMPDEVFWAKVKEAEIEKYERELNPAETAEALKDGDSILSKLARDRPRFK
jgi:hypothetical protein